MKTILERKKLRKNFLQISVIFENCKKANNISVIEDKISIPPKKVLENFIKKSIL